MGLRFMSFVAKFVIITLLVVILARIKYGVNSSEGLHTTIILGFSPRIQWGRGGA